VLIIVLKQFDEDFPQLSNNVLDKVLIYKIKLNYYNITFIFLYFHLQCAVISTWQSPMRCVIYSGALEIKIDNLQCAQCAENLQCVF